MENKDTLKDKDIIKKKEPITRVIEAPNIDLNDELTKKIYEVLLATGAAQPAGTVVTLGATTMTEHIELNQWEPEDVPIRMDFNDDNLKIDTAFYELNENLSDKISTLSTDLSNVIESGENSNGHWIKFADGTLIQHRFFTLTLAINTPFGGVFHAGSHRWTFPIPFIDNDYGLSGVAGARGDAGILSWNPPGTREVIDLRVINPVARASNTIYFKVQAIGRWR